MNTRFVANTLRNYPVKLNDGREGYITPLKWIDVFYDPKGVPIFDTFSGEVSVNGLIRIHIGKCHFTTVKLGDINTINGKSVNSALDEAGDDHFRLVELLR